MQPRMVIVAGPPGSGKSTAFPGNSLGVDFFNADDLAAELNGGSYQGIPTAIRLQTGKEFEHFVNEHIKNAIETKSLQECDTTSVNHSSRCQSA